MGNSKTVNFSDAEPNKNYRIASFADGDGWDGQVAVGATGYVPTAVNKKDSADEQVAEGEAINEGLGIFHLDTPIQNNGHTQYTVDLANETQLQLVG